MDQFDYSNFSNEGEELKRLNTDSFSTNIPIQNGCNKTTDSCAVVENDCPENKSIVYHPSPEPYIPWCWQSALIHSFIASLFVYTIILWTRLPPLGPGAEGIAQGLAVVVSITVFFDKHAGFINPVLVLLLAALGKLPGQAWGVLTYIAAQVLAAIVATLLVWGITPGFDRSFGLGTPFTPGFIGNSRGAVAEFTGSFFYFLMAVLAIGWYDDYLVNSNATILISKTNEDPKYKVKKILFPFRIFIAVIIGFTVGVLVVALRPISGGNFNPLLWIFPAAISGLIDNSPVNNQWWIYIIMPFVGAILVWILAFGIFYWGKVRMAKHHKKGSKSN